MIQKLKGAFLIYAWDNLFLQLAGIPKDQIQSTYEVGVTMSLKVFNAAQRD